MTTYYISPGGNNGNSGLTSLLPWKTFLQAATVMAAGDTLMLMDGTYTVAAGTGDMTFTGAGSATPKTGTSKALPTIYQAVNPGLAIVDGIWIGRSPGAGSTTSFVKILDIKAAATGGIVLYNAVNCYIKNCASLGPISIGTSDHTEGNTDNLIEDCWASVAGARILCTNYRAHRNIWRRVVIRGEGCGTVACTGSGNPNVGLTCYESQDCWFENVIVIDRLLALAPNVDFPYADFATAQHTASAPLFLGHNQWMGCMSVGSMDLGFQFEADAPNTVNQTWTMENCVAAPTKSTVNPPSQMGGFNVGQPGTIQLQNLTAISPTAPNARAAWLTATAYVVGDEATNGGVGYRCRTAHTSGTFATDLAAFKWIKAGDGLRVVGPSATYVRNVIAKGWDRGLNSQVQPTYTDVFANTTNYNQTTPVTGVNTTDPRADTGPSLKYLPRIEAGSTLKAAGNAGADIGANVVFKFGTDGTFFGDSGYDTVTANNLWPWPNEDRIKTDLAAVSVRGFCAAGNRLDGVNPITLTSYVWEYLGVQMPSNIYPSPGVASYCAGLTTVKVG